MADYLLPAGFRTSGLHCGIKEDPARFDLALFVSDRPATAAGTFTKNQVCGAPVQVCRERLPRETARGVVINSGIANACTGDQGLEDARWMTGLVGEGLGCSTDDVLVCSTGVIGHYLPRDPLAQGIPAAVAALGSDAQAFVAAARGMMTTDTVSKQSVRDLNIGGSPVRISGAAKGAAMIAPNMATMLAVVMTDAVLAPALAASLLQAAVDESFNCISVEGHTSTSDSVILLANGASESGPQTPETEEEFRAVLTDVCGELAQMIVRDAEGAAHFVTLNVRGLPSRDAARTVAHEIATDVLVKTAMTGNDPNWGRIISASGRTPVEVNQQIASLTINGTLIFDRGAPTEYDEPTVSQSMATGDVVIDLSFNLGEHGIRVWTSDLTQEYVRLNSEYTT